MVHWWQHYYWLRIQIHKLHASELYDAIFSCVSEKVVAHNQSIGVNAVLKYDRRQGEEILQLGNDSNSSFGTNLYLHKNSGSSCRVCVEYDQGSNLCVGKEQAMKQSSCITLWVTPRTAASRELIKEWMTACLDDSRKQLGNQINVYSLQETSKDWIPEWKFIGTRPAKTCEGQGLEFYISRPECLAIYKHAKIFMDSFLCCYHVHGASGSGKSEFAAWLAGMLHAPLYILNLNCPGLDDGRLLSVVGYAGFHHSDPVVLLVDEFQAVYQKLAARDLTIGITLEGFHQFIQSAGSLRNGVLLLCSLEDDSRLDTPTTRRIQSSIELTPFTPPQLCLMAAHFLISKSPGVTWPDDIEEVARYLLSNQEAQSLQTIDEMMEFIRRRLSSSSDRTDANGNDWSTFLDVLFRGQPRRDLADVKSGSQPRKRHKV